MITEQRYIARPIRSLQTMLHVLAAADERYEDVVPDGVYAERTAAAVAQFQRVNALPVTAQTDHETWNCIVNEFTKKSAEVLPAEPLRIVWQPKQRIVPGQKNLHLHLIQAMLLALQSVYSGLPEIRVTGVHDAASVAAVRWLQEKAALDADGEIDQTTWLYLCRLYRITAGDGTQSRDGTMYTGE